MVVERKSVYKALYELTKIPKIATSAQKMIKNTDWNAPNKDNISILLSLTTFQYQEDTDLVCCIFSAYRMMLI